MNLQQHSDWHKHGVFMVVSPEGRPIHDTCNETAYGARSTFVREKNHLWSKAKSDGYEVYEFTPIAQVVAANS